MSIVKIRAALESHLAGMSGVLPTSYENAQFLPVSGVAFQKVNLLPADTENPSIGAELHRELGVFQVSLYYPLNQGATACATMAENIRTRFARGTTITKDSVTVMIDSTPSISSGTVDGDRWFVAVSINYSADIFI
jgi:hypothetical protein